MFYIEIYSTTHTICNGSSFGFSDACTLLACPASESLASESFASELSNSVDVNSKSMF